LQPAVFTCASLSSRHVIVAFTRHHVPSLGQHKPLPTTHRTPFGHRTTLAEAQNAKTRHVLGPSDKYKYFLPPSTLDFEKSALFAFWLRSSVVSVLFSLISETFLRELLRLSTFWIHRGPLSLLMPSVSVASIALPLADANHSLFHQFLRLSKVLEKKPLSMLCKKCHLLRAM
jgi:hypothetical protein